LWAMLESVGVQGREVIVPSFTFISTANSVIHAGGKPVFADIEDESFGLDPKDVERKITKKTVAIMPVHYGGMACRINEIAKLAKKHNLILLEDAAEAMGVKVGPKPVGSFSTAAMFSFTPSKIVSTGEGGVVVTNSRKTLEELKLFRSHGRNETEDYFTTTKNLDYISLGYGLRLPTVSAAQGLAQLNHLHNIIAKRKKLAKVYLKKLAGVDGLGWPDSYNRVDECTYQMFTVIVKKGKKKRDGMQAYLKTKGITCKIYFSPIHQTHFYKKVVKNSPKLKLTENLGDQVLSLPIYPDLTKDMVEKICKEIKKFLRNG